MFLMLSPEQSLFELNEILKCDNFQKDNNDKKKKEMRAKKIIFFSKLKTKSFTRLFSSWEFIFSLALRPLKLKRKKKEQTATSN